MCQQIDKAGELLDDLVPVGCRHQGVLYVLRTQARGSGGGTPGKGSHFLLDGRGVDLGGGGRVDGRQAGQVHWLLAGRVLAAHLVQDGWSN